MHPVCSFMLFCVGAHMHNLHLCVCVCVFEVVLSFSAFLSHDRRDGGEAGVVVRRWTRGSWAEAVQPATPVSVEVQEQVEVWILNIEKLHRGSIFTPMATALKGEDGDGLSASSIPQTWLKGNCKELLNWVLEPKFSELTDCYILILNIYFIIISVLNTDLQTWP